MTAVYVLNSPVLTSYGDWVFEGPIEVEQAQAMLQAGFISAIGHQGAADFLSAAGRIELIAKVRSAQASTP